MAKRAVKVRIEGLEELKVKMRRLGVDVERSLDRAARAGAEVVREETASRAPGPHVVFERDPKGQPERPQYLIGPDKEHWYYQFFETGAGQHEIDGKTRKALLFPGKSGMLVRRKVGHPGMGASPFLRPGLEAAKEAAVDAVGKVLKAAVERVAE